MGKIHHLRPPERPSRLTPPAPPHLVSGVLTATVTLSGAAAERTIISAGMSGKSPDHYLSDLVACMVLLTCKDGER